MNNNEIWKPVVGFEVTHMISNLGNVRVLAREHINSIGRIHRRSEKLITKFTSHWGYSHVYLCVGGNKKQKKFVHRLVAEAFIQNPDNKPQVNHINGVKTDNRLENLEWCTQSENQRHAIRTGLKRVFAGENNHCAKLTMDQVREIRGAYVKKYGVITALARKYNVSDTAIYYVIQNKTYAE